MRKKYTRITLTLDTLSAALSAFAVLTGTGGIDLTLSGVGAPAGAVLEALAVTGGLTLGVGRVAWKKFDKKAKQHERIAQAAATILRTVGNITSRALNDCRVSHEEFEQVLD